MGTETQAGHITSRVAMARKSRLMFWKGWKAALATGQGDAEYWKQRYDKVTKELTAIGEV